MTRFQILVLKLLRADSEPVEVLDGFTLLLVGIALIAPGNTYDMPIYHVMATLIGENDAGLLFLLSGLLILLAVWKGRVLFRRIMLIPAIVLLTALATMFLLSNYTSPAIAFYAPAFGAVWAFIRLRG